MNAAIVQPGDQVIGALAGPQMNVYEGCVGKVGGDQTFSIRRAANRSGDQRVARLKQASYRHAEVP